MWQSPDGTAVPSYTIITTRANNKMRALHERMPVMLIPEEWDWWPDPGRQDLATLIDFFDPFPDDAIEFYQVSKQVSNIRNNSANFG